MFLESGTFCFGFRDSKYIPSDGSWSYEGFYAIENGDYLTIFSPQDPTEVVWTGTIFLHQHGCRQTQTGVDDKTWNDFFRKEFPAELIEVDKSAGDDTQGGGHLTTDQKNKIAQELGADWSIPVSQLLDKLAIIMNDEKLPMTVRDAARKEFQKLNAATKPLP